MDFKCNCGLRTRLVGDGCSVCNTDYALDVLPRPTELAKDLCVSGFSEDQATRLYLRRDVSTNDGDYYNT